MKLVIALLLLVSLNAYADSSVCEQSTTENLTQEQIIAQRGCCSWHGGVCGCSGSRAKCCDGALSPTCGCHSDDVLEELKSLEVFKSNS